MIAPPISRSDTPPPDSNSVSERIGRYRILERLGQGGVGEVYAAIFEEDGELCALKRLRTELQNHAPARVRLKREARIAAELSHPNIARVLRTSDEDGMFCIATEFVPGVDLDTIISALAAEGRALSAPTAAAVILPILNALAYAHEATGPNGPLNLVHRDLSAGNVMLTFSGNVKIIDFGVAHADIDDFQTSPGVLVGTLRSLSPEQARGEPVDKRSDLYAVGVLLYELLTARCLLKTAHPLLAALEEIANRTPPSIIEDNYTIAPEMDALVQKALAQSADERFADATLFAQELQNIIGKPSSEDVLKEILSYLFPEIRQRWARLEERVRRTVMAAGFEPERKISGPDWDAISEVSHIDRDLFAESIHFPTTSSDVPIPEEHPTVSDGDHPSQKLTNDMLGVPGPSLSATDWLDATDLVPVMTEDVPPSMGLPIQPAAEVKTDAAPPPEPRTTSQNASLPFTPDPLALETDANDPINANKDAASVDPHASGLQNEVFSLGSEHEEDAERDIKTSVITPPHAAPTAQIPPPPERTISEPGPSLPVPPRSKPVTPSKPLYSRSKPMTPSKPVPHRPERATPSVSAMAQSNGLGFREGLLLGLIPTAVLVLWLLLR